MLPSSGQLFSDEILLLGIKFMFVTGGLLYTLFAFVVVRQISIMGKTIRTVASPYIKLLGYIHFIAAIVVLIYFFTVL